MEQEDLEKVLTQYIQEKPKITDEEFLGILQGCRKNALLTTIPDYKPTRVEDRQKIGTEYEEKRKKLERRPYVDESTTEEFE